MNSEDKFYSLTNKDREHMKRFYIVSYVLAVNSIVLLVLGLNMKWSDDYVILCVIVICFYLFLILAHSKDKPFFSEVFKRLKVWRDYYISERFMNSYNDNDFPPIQNGDYILLFENKTDGNYRREYMLFNVDSHYRGKECFTKDLYEQRYQLLDIVTHGVCYTSEIHDDYHTTETMYELQMEVEKKGYFIKAIYNNYGDMKWQESKYPKPPSSYRRFIYKIKVVLWYLMTIVVVVAPFLPFLIHMYKT